MTSRVLILSAWDDPHAAALQWSLRKNNVDSIITPSALSSADAKLSLWCDDGQTRIESNEFLSSSGDFRSVWNRRPAPPKITGCLDADRDFIFQQWRYFQKNIFDLGQQLDGKLWVNHPPAAIRAESKLVQLDAARQAGLRFPEMVVTNDARDVQALIKRHGRVIYKTFYPQSWQSASTGRIYDMGVALLDSSSDLPDAALAVCPGIFQRYVDKAYDVRITIVGAHMFAVRMLKRSGEAYLDWRQDVLAEETLMEPYTLSQATEDKLRDLMQRLGIVFGCADIVVDHDGNEHFLEVNQAGQFVFVEEKLPSVPLLRAMTAMLSKGSVDYSVNDATDASFNDFLKTDEYEKVMDSLRQEPLRVSMEA
jgi:glutathione synthase/RimK-type ligase-like ATP-grasp enzyme